jgi:hypothetical protein
MKHPTLRMFHKWLGYNLFHRDDIRKVRVGDLQLLYAAIKKYPLHLLLFWFLIGLVYLVFRDLSVVLHSSLV